MTKRLQLHIDITPTLLDIADKRRAQLGLKTMSEYVRVLFLADSKEFMFGGINNELKNE